MTFNPTPQPTGTEARVCALIAQRQQYGRWTLISQVAPGKHEKWLARCACGKEKVVLLGNLKRGKSTSCGCFRSEVSAERSTTHGQTGKTSTYRSWAHLKGRCLNETDAAFKDYGGRGIRVCERWLEFENFYQDTGDCPPKHSIERLDVNGNYEPSNCVWLHISLQMRNTRMTRFSEKDVADIRRRLSDGEMTKVIAAEYGVEAGHIRQIRGSHIWKN